MRRLMLRCRLLFRTFGRYVQTLNGRYITCEDVGTNPKMMEFVRIETRHVVGLPNHIGGLGDPSPVTAYGTMLGMKASWKKITGKANFLFYSFSDSIVIAVPLEDTHVSEYKDKLKHLGIVVATLQYHLSKNKIWFLQIQNIW